MVKIKVLTGCGIHTKAFAETNGRLFVEVRRHERDENQCFLCIKIYALTMNLAWVI